MSIRIVAILIGTATCRSLTFGQEIPREAPPGFGQLENPPAIIPGGVDQEGRKYQYNGQPANNNKLIFTASNGFFTKGTCRAAGESKLPKVGDEKLIGPNFAWLEVFHGEGSGKIRVHTSEIHSGRFFTIKQIEQWIEKRPGDFATGFVTCFKEWKGRI